MAVISVPRELRETLGDAATDGLWICCIDLGDEQRQNLIAVVEERFARRVAESRDDLRGEVHDGIDSLRSEMHAGIDSLRSEMHASIDSLRSDMHAGFAEVQKQFLDHQQKIGNLGKEIAGVRADLTKEIGAVRTDLTKEIGAVRTDLTRRSAKCTRRLPYRLGWLLTVLIAATVLIPVMQRVLAAVFSLTPGASPPATPKPDGPTIGRCQRSGGEASPEAPIASRYRSTGSF